MTDERIPEPSEAFALGALHAIFIQNGIKVDLPFDVKDRAIDVTGLCPGATIRITVEEVS